jgi:hypothetical protein
MCSALQCKVMCAMCSDVCNVKYSVQCAVLSVICSTQHITMCNVPCDVCCYALHSAEYSSTVLNVHCVKCTLCYVLHCATLLNTVAVQCSGAAQRSAVMECGGAVLSRGHSCGAIPVRSCQTDSITNLLPS